LLPVGCVALKVEILPFITIPAQLAKPTAPTEAPAIPPPILAALLTFPQGFFEGSSLNVGTLSMGKELKLVSFSICFKLSVKGK
jgi:hypothetical protein